MSPLSISTVFAPRLVLTLLDTPPGYPHLHTCNMFTVAPHHNVSACQHILRFSTVDPQSQPYFFSVKVAS